MRETIEIDRRPKAPVIVTTEHASFLDHIAACGNCVRHHAYTEMCEEAHQLMQEMNRSYPRCA